MRPICLKTVVAERAATAIVGDIMTIIALYAFQVLIGILFLAAGYAKLTGMEFMSEPFATMGLGRSALVIAGSVEIVAGTCLLSVSAISSIGLLSIVWR